MGLYSWKGKKEESEFLPVRREFIEDKEREHTSRERQAGSREIMVLEGWGAGCLRQGYVNNPRSC